MEWFRSSHSPDDNEELKPDELTKRVDEKVDLNYP